MQMQQQQVPQYAPQIQSTALVALPNAAAQSYIHELAKGLPAPRKQNSACDACRSRKVKCNREDGAEKCNHCLAKNYPCTNHVQQATAEKRRTTGVVRRQRGNSSVASSAAPYTKSYAPGPIGSVPTLELRNANLNVRTNVTASANVFATDYGVSNLANAFGSMDLIEASPIRMDMSPAQLVLHMLAPPTPPNGQAAGFSRAELYAMWGEEAHKLDDPTYRALVADDLVEVFFQIVHSRWPLLSPDDFRRRFNIRTDPTDASASFTLASPPMSNQSLSPPPMSPSSSSYSSASATAFTSSGSSSAGSSSGPLHPAIIATVLAWGAKFSEHELFRVDREKNGGQGLLAKAIIERARAVAEVLKVPRIATPENVIVGLLLEPVQPQNPDDPSGFQGYWLSAAVKHLTTLQYNKQSVVVNIPDSGTRQIMIFCWWMACLCDAYSSVYYRRKPDLDDDDYNVEVYTIDSLEEDGQPTPPSTPHQLELIGYYNANHVLARIARSISKQLWKPATEENGVPIDALTDMFASLEQWRHEWLSKVGVPTNSTAGWDFLAAISACASDATYHVMWIIIFNAVDDFGIREELEEPAKSEPQSMFAQTPAYRPRGNGKVNVEEVKTKLFQEAQHGALRIAGLAGVLASNGYLRLDTAVMHVSCIQAGMLLARLGRPEVANCIAALQQYSYAYEEAAEQGNEIERMFNAAQGGERDLDHMASTVYSQQQQENASSASTNGMRM